MPYLRGTRRHPVLAGGRLAPLDFNVGLATLTPGMAKRTAPGPFAAAPIVQGAWDGTGTPDVVSFARGNLIGDQDGHWYDNLDPYQGSIVFWITPEWDGDDGIRHMLLDLGVDYFYIYKHPTGSDLYFQLVVAGISLTAYVDVSGWVAGATHCVVIRWDIKNPLDGTNYVCISVDGAHSFQDSDPGSGAPRVGSNLYIGSSDSSEHPANALIEGLTIYRRPLWDGAYGVDVSGGTDEIAAIHAAGVGLDPCLVTGSWDVCFALPTDSQVGALA